MANTLDIKTDNRHRTQVHRAYFIPWDGEGITFEGETQQSYVLFGTPWKRIVRCEPGGLHTTECLDLMESVALLHPTGIHVVYAGGYDFQMILQDADVNALNRLNSGKRAYVGDYNIEWIPGKMLRWRYEPWDPTIKKHVPRATRPWRVMYDVFSFFQTSFVNACETWGIGTPEEHEEMRRMKSLRSDFTTEMFISEVVPYWKKELSFLQQLMEAFQTELKNVDIRIINWFGPGAIASAIYKKSKIKKHMQQGTTEFVNDAAQCAYMGGRFEQLKVGHVDRAWFYDINSAYPSFIRQLPSLKGATWHHHENPKHYYAPVRRFSLYRVEFKSWPEARRKREGHRPFPLWARNKRGGVQFGPGLGNWVWEPEYALLLKYFPDDVIVHDWLEFIPGDPTLPFGWVDDLYLQRLEYKNRGYGAERILKLALNSLYGKMAQQTGARQDKGGAWRLPPFHQLEWAGWVTSSTRAKLFHAAMLAPDDIIAFETDAVFSLSPLPLPTSKALGDWGCDVLTGLTYVQTGVSWAHTEDKTKAKYRGFDHESLTEEDVLNAWRVGLSSVPGSTTRFQSLGYSFNVGDLRGWRQWIKKERNLVVLPDRVDGRSLVESGPIVDVMKPLAIYGKANDPGWGRPYYLAWKNPTEYEQLSLFSDDSEEL